MLFDKIINTAFSFGAAVVIFGAWGKIEHKEFGSTALTAGLLTETAIFCIYGILEWRKKPDPAENGTVAGAERLEGQGRQADQANELSDAIRQVSQVLTKVFRL